MEITARHIKKLRGRSAAELGTRGRQALSVLGERLFKLHNGEMSDHRFVDHISANAQSSRRRTVPARANAAPGLRANRRAGAFLAQREAVAGLMNDRFRAERDLLIDRADRACRGKFDLMGFRNLEFGDPIDWRLDPVSGKRTPLKHWSRIDYLNPGVAGDKKITWELNRHSHFVTLGQAYWMTGDERYAQTFAAQATSWMDNNPPKLGINWASSLELAIRCIAWIWALRLFEASESLASSFLKRLVKYILIQANHIESYLSEYFSPNTHLTGEALGLFYIGASFTEFRRARAWRETGLRIMLEQLPAQVHPDGVYFERSTYYHRYTADFYIHLLVLAAENGIELPPSVEGALTGLLDHLMWITRPDGLSPLIGDDDGGRLVNFGTAPPDDFRGTLAVGAALFGRGDWKFVAGAAAMDVLWLLGPEGLSRLHELSAEAPNQTSRPFPEGGVYVMRDGWTADSTFAIVSCGPHASLSGAHAHADNLSFEFACSGTTWLVDPGTFSYTGDTDARERMRSSSGHNTAVVDGCSQSEPSGPFSWNSRANGTCAEFISGDDTWFFEGIQDGYLRLADPVGHTRSILMRGMSARPESNGSLPPYLVVRDRLSATGYHRASVSYHFSPGIRVNRNRGDLEVTNNTGAELNIVAFGTRPVASTLHKGWVSRCYGSRSEAAVATFEICGDRDQELITAIVPSKAPSPPAIEPLQNADSVLAGLKLSTANRTEMVLLGCQDRDAAAAGISARGKAAIVSLVDEAPVEACLFSGTAIRVDGWISLVASTPIEYCAIRRRAGSALEVCMGNAGEFDLEVPSGTDQIVVNGTGFSVQSGGNRFTFTRKGAGWEQTPAQ